MNGSYPYGELIKSEKNTSKTPNEMLQIKEIGGYKDTT